MTSKPIRNRLRNLYPTLDTESQGQLSAYMHSLRTTDSKPELYNIGFTRGWASKRVCGSLRPVQFSGFVESDAGTKSVEVEIRCLDTGKYWSDAGWSETNSRIAASLLQPGGLISGWSLKLNTNRYARTKDSILAAQNVALSVIACDSKDRCTVVEDALQFSLAFDDPETTVDAIQKDQTNENSLTISGSASDLNSIKTVRVAIQSGQTREYWDGKQWSKTFAYSDAVISSTNKTGELVQCDWNLNVSIPDAPNFIVIARSYDNSRNYDRTRRP